MALQPKKTALPAAPPRPVRLNGYITFLGKGDHQDQFTVLAGENPPTPISGYAKWETIPRPLLRGLTVFQGYDPVAMKLEIRFGVWSDLFAWSTDDTAGQAVERDIAKLEWMAGARRSAGPPPYVYLNTYGNQGGTTSLIPLEYQQSLGINGPLADPTVWPWVITGLEWGAAYRNHPSAYRVRQDATVTVTNFQGLSPPPQKSTAGGYFTSVPGRDTALLIAAAPSGRALFPQALAQRIQNDPKNNPVKDSRISLRNKSQRWQIPHGRQIWIPAHQT